MHMHGGHPWQWYQPVTKANANGGHGGHHLHRPGDQAVIDKKAEIIYVATMVTACCNLVKKGGGSRHVAGKYHDILPQTHTE